MDLEFQLVEPDEHHPSHFVVVAVFESGEKLELIGFKNRRDAVIIADTAYGPAEWASPLRYIIRA